MFSPEFCARYVVFWSEDAAAAADAEGMTHIVMACGDFTDLDCTCYLTNLQRAPLQPRVIPAMLIDCYISHVYARRYHIYGRDGSAICSVCWRGEPRMDHCERCGVTTYCSAECQRADWRAHKPMCVPRTPGLSRREQRNAMHNHKTYGWKVITRERYDNLLELIQNGPHLLPNTVPAGETHLDAD